MERRGDQSVRERPLLTDNEHLVLERRYIPRVPETLENIGRDLGSLSRQRVGQIQQSGERKLARHYLESLGLLSDSV